ncbi:MAG: hypothetical protein ACT4QF_04635 [Sporichthyaceae bacterium]
MRRQCLRRIAAFSMFGALSGLAIVGPASAHSGGRAVVLVRSLAVEPAGSGWQVAAVLTDSDSGSPILGPRVSALVGEDPAKATEVVMNATGTAARFVASLPAVKPGPLALALKVRSSPGADPVQPLNTRVFTTVLVSGTTATLVSGGGEEGGGSLPLIMGASGALLALALLYGLYSLRRPSAGTESAQ